ncbi:MAG: PQQ-dependent sugar dehydrogenase [Pirellulales bacterium]
MLMESLKARSTKSADNPFLNEAGAQPEIYAFGFRNPWRIAFDKATGKLWCADVGQELWEEIDIVEKGANYGWSSREGTKPFSNRSSHTKFAPRDQFGSMTTASGKSYHRRSRLSQRRSAIASAQWQMPACGLCQRWCLGVEC